MRVQGVMRSDQHMECQNRTDKFIGKDQHMDYANQSGQLHTGTIHGDLRGFEVRYSPVRNSLHLADTELQL